MIFKTLKIQKIIKMYEIYYYYLYLFINFKISYTYFYMSNFKYFINIRHGYNSFAIRGI